MFGLIVDAGYNFYPYLLIRNILPKVPKYFINEFNNYFKYDYIKNKNYMSQEKEQKGLIFCNWNHFEKILV